MPGLTVFNRRWMLSSDDLVIPCSIAFGIRTIWLILVVIFFTVDTINLKDFEHSCFKTVRIYFIVYICVLVASAINDVLIAFVSSRGTIYEEVKRKPIPRLLYCRAIVLVWEFCCACVGCYYVIYKIQVCENTYSKWLSEAIVVFNFLTVFICLTMILLSYDSAGNLWYKLEQNNHYNSLDVLQCKREISEKYQKDWMKSCRLLFCCTKKEISKDNVLMFASKLFADYFQRYADLVPSDILAGLILLRQKQKYEESVFVASEVEKENSDYQQARKRRTSKSIRRHQRTPNSTPFNVNNQDEMSLLSEVTYFAKYALACYGWPMYCFLHNIPICCLPGCKLLSKVRCCACCQKLPEHHPPITGDNCCLCNFAAQKVTLDAGNENFVYVNYSSKVFQTPFNVIVDHFKKSIVISCRGTLSLQDVLTDLAIDEERIPDCDPKWTAHKGFLSAAVKVKAIIEEKRLIEKAQTFITDKDSNDYKIVIVGHSLGAGTATLLAFLFKAKYPSLVCYAYGPSGSAVSYEASVYARDFIYSVVLGKDIISRLNLHTIHELQHNILELLRMCHLPKWKILRGCICQCILCGTDSAKPSYVDYFKDNDDMLNIKPYNPENQQKLYMAGKVVHICKIKSVYPRFSRKRSIYQAYWSIPEDFQNILISRLMLEDHFPDALINAMNSILPDDSDDFVTIWSENENGKANANIISPIKKYESLAVI